ncbi:MAG TPA: MarR family transcriptional regulator [Ramlibacter sp.]
MPRAAATKAPPRTAPPAEVRKPIRRPAKVVDLQTYSPAYFTWIANKLSSGASQAYLAAFDVGIETWRLLVLLAIEPSLSAQRICKVIGMDKASVSRAFKSMQERGFITIGLDAQDGRLRVATITPAGRDVHDRILAIALERERALMSVLAPQERETLLVLLRRLHDNLPAVEAATARYLALHYPHAARRRRKAVSEE